MGESRAEELRKLEDLKNASRGLYVSKTGKLPDTGGLSGQDYDEFISIREAFKGKDSRLPGACKVDGEHFNYNYGNIVKLFAKNGGKPLFIAAKRNGSVLEHGDYSGEKGFVIQFSPYLFPRGSTLAGTGKRYLYFAEWDLAYHTK